MFSQREPATHKLRTWPRFFKAVSEGYKTFEAQKDDRNYSQGDTLILQEYDQLENRYTGREQVAKVTFVLRKYKGLVPGFCIMGLRLVGSVRTNPALVRPGTVKEG
jgi:hypothetical protein